MYFKVEKMVNNYINVIKQIIFYYAYRAKQAYTSVIVEYI